MNAGGLVLVIAGVWLGCQVFGGDAFHRLNMAPGSSSSSSTSKPAVATAPATGPDPTVRNA